MTYSPLDGLPSVFPMPTSPPDPPILSIFTVGMNEGLLTSLCSFEGIVSERASRSAIALLMRGFSCPNDGIGPSWSALPLSMSFSYSLSFPIGNLIF